MKKRGRSGADVHVTHNCPGPLRKLLLPGNQTVYVKDIKSRKPLKKFCKLNLPLAKAGNVWYNTNTRQRRDTG